MENYVNGKVLGHESFDYGGKKVRAVAMVRDGQNKLTLLVLDISEKDKNVPVPSGDWLEVSRSIRGELLRIIQNEKEPCGRRTMAKILLKEDIYFINDSTDSGRVSGNPGVYAHG